MHEYKIDKVYGPTRYKVTYLSYELGIYTESDSILSVDFDSYDIRKFAQDQIFPFQAFYIREFRTFKTTVQKIATGKAFVAEDVEYGKISSIHYISATAVNMSDLSQRKYRDAAPKTDLLHLIKHSGADKLMYCRSGSWLPYHKEHTNIIIL